LKHPTLSKLWSSGAMSLLSWLLVILAGLSLAAMVVSITIANRSAREARSTIFPVVREEETVRARRARITTSVMGVIAAIMAGAFFLSGQLPSLSVPTLPSPAEFVAIVESPVTEVVSPEVEMIAPAVPTETPLPPTEEPIEAQKTPASSQVILSTPQSLSEETPTPLATPTPVPPAPTPTPPVLATRAPTLSSSTAAGSPIPAPVDVEMGPIAFATQITNRRDPISPTTIFSNTVSRVYATFPYTGMQNGLTWTQVWYFEDDEYSRGAENWEWGNDDRSFVFTKLVGAGDYRLELYVNEELVASGGFTVVGPPAIGGPRTPESQGTPERTATSESEETPESPGGSVTPESP
jgi:hypothetical protein